MMNVLSFGGKPMTRTKLSVREALADFWQRWESSGCQNGNCVSIYMLLLSHWADLEKPDTIQMQNKEIIQTLRISDPTFQKARLTLAQMKLISYKSEGKGDADIFYQLLNTKNVKILHSIPLKSHDEEKGAKTENIPFLNGNNVKILHTKGEKKVQSGFLEFSKNGKSENAPFLNTKNVKILYSFLEKVPLFLLYKEWLNNIKNLTSYTNCIILELDKYNTEKNIGFDPNQQKNLQKKSEKFLRKKFIAPDIAETELYFMKKTSAIWPVRMIKEQAEEFFNHYTANGWVQGRQGKPLVNWQAAAAQWISRATRGTFSEETKIKRPPCPEDQAEKLKADISDLYGKYLKDQKVFKLLKPEHYDLVKSLGMFKAVFHASVLADIEAKARKTRMNQLQGTNQHHELILLQGYEGNNEALIEPDKENILKIKKRLSLGELFAIKKKANQTNFF